MNASNLYVVVCHWHDGKVSYSMPYRGQARAFRMAMRYRDIGMASHVEIVTEREAGARKLAAIEAAT
jgi:hypothetical protein